MKISALLLLLYLCQEVVPYKSKEEFEIKIDYQFKQRPPEDRTIMRVDGSAGSKSASTILPYLKLNVKMLQSTDSKVRITSSQNELVGSKKMKEGLIIPIDYGFTDDVKDRVTPHEYVLTFLSDTREETSRIVLFIDKDGTFLVNGETRGRF